MALKECRECKAQVSSKAKTCPSCGISRPYQSKGSAVLGFAILGFFGLLIYGMHSADQESEAEERAEAQYLAAHPLTPQQVAANEHFNKCYQYKDTPQSVWSDRQRQLMLGMEGCYADDRDDPRYQDATSPWNHEAPTPWKKRD